MESRKTYTIRGHKFYQEELSFEEILKLLDIFSESADIKDENVLNMIKKGIIKYMDSAMRIILKPIEGKYPEKGFFNKIPGSVGMEVISDFFYFNKPESYIHSIEKIFKMFNPVLKKMGIEINLKHIENTLKDSFAGSQTETLQKGS